MGIPMTEYEPRIRGDLGPIATAIGWAHPVTGEQLTSIRGLADTVGYYKPNSRYNAFNSPNTTVVAFLALYTTPSNPLEVVLNLDITGEFEDVVIDWGDGTEETEETAGPFNHIYDSAGTIEISVRVNFADGSHEIVDITEELNDVGFSWDAETGGEPLEINFHPSLITTDLEDVTWDFGDESEPVVVASDFLDSLSHVYEQEGVYEVTMTATYSGDVTHTYSTQVVVEDTESVPEEG